MTIRHIVLLTLKPEITHADRDYLFGRIRKMSGMPSVRRLAIGTLLDPKDPGYRSHISSEHSHALLVEFADEDGLYAYQKDPLHVEVAREIRERTSAVKVVDFVASDEAPASPSRS